MLLLCPPAAAVEPDASRDVELVRPAFSACAVFSVDSPTLGPRGAVRVGSLIQYERQPVVAPVDGAYTADIVTNRVIATPGWPSRSTSGCSASNGVSARARDAAPICVRHEQMELLLLVPGHA